MVFGVNYFPSKRNSPSLFNNFCLYNESILTKDEYENTYRYDYHLCRNCDQQTCLHSGYCGIGSGCYIIYDLDGTSNLNTSILQKYLIQECEGYTRVHKGTDDIMPVSFNLYL